MSRVNGRKILSIVAATTALVLATAAGIAEVVTPESAQIAPESVEVPGWAFGWVQLIVVGLVGLSWWSIRKTYADHERRLERLERKEANDVDRLTAAVHQLEITAAEIRATCPFCRGSLVVRPAPPEPPNPGRIRAVGDDV